MFVEFDIKEMAARLTSTYDIEMKGDLALATQMMIAEKLSDIEEKISSIEYKFSTDN